MRTIKRFAAVFVATVCVFLSGTQAFARQINFDEWNYHEQVIVIADSDAESNSGLRNAQLKVKYDYPSHRMTLLFTLKFDSFTDGDNPSVMLSLNRDESISFNLNGESEYNEDKYYLDFLSYAQPTNGVVYFEVTLGVKEGIAATNVLTVVFTDPQGVLSNTYVVNLVEDELNLSEDDQPSDEDDEDDESQGKSKTSKTTKTKTTKVKTTKNKTTKTKKTKAEEADEALTEQKGEAELHRSEEGELQNQSDNEKILFVSVAVIVVSGLVLTGGLHYLKRNKHKGDK